MKQPESFTVFDAPGAGTAPDQGTYAYQTNNSGVSTGTYFDSNTTYHGFVRAVDGRIKSFDPRKCINTRAFSINITGAITGYYQDGKGRYHGFVRIR